MTLGARTHSRTCRPRYLDTSQHQAGGTSIASRQWHVMRGGNRTAPEQACWSLSLAPVFRPLGGLGLRDGSGPARVQAARRPHQRGSLIPATPLQSGRCVRQPHALPPQPLRRQLAGAEGRRVRESACGGMLATITPGMRRRVCSCERRPAMFQKCTAPCCAPCTQRHSARCTRNQFVSLCDSCTAQMPNLNICTVSKCCTRCSDMHSEYSSGSRGLLQHTVLGAQLDSHAACSLLWNQPAVGQCSRLHARS